MNSTKQEIFNNILFNVFGNCIHCTLYKNLSVFSSDPLQLLHLPYLGKDFNLVPVEDQQRFKDFCDFIRFFDYNFNNKYHHLKQSCIKGNWTPIKKN